MSDKDTIYRQDAIDAMNQIFCHVEMISGRPITKGERALFLDMRETIKALPSAQQCMTATSNTMVSDTVKIPVMDGTTERLPSAQPEHLVKESGDLVKDLVNDCISRQDAIRWIKVECNPYGKPTLDYESGKRVIKYLERMPSAEPRKKGKWIKIPEFCGDDVSGFIDNHFSCSECKKEAEINSWGFYILSDFCPNCGADMRGEQDD